MTQRQLVLGEVALKCGGICSGHCESSMGLGRSHSKECHAETCMARIRDPKPPFEQIRQNCYPEAT